MNQNFGLPYQSIPNMMPNMMMNVPPTIINSECTNGYDMSDIDRRLDTLERKVRNIENYINGKSDINNNYSGSNYQML